MDRSSPWLFGPILSRVRGQHSPAVLQANYVLHEISASQRLIVIVLKNRVGKQMLESNLLF